MLFFAFSVQAQLPVVNSFDPQSASEGSQVSIHGSNLSNVTAVSFGGTPASFYFAADDNTIYATVGHGTSGNVIVTNASGPASLPGFIYLFSPDITFFTPASAGENDTVAIHGHYFTGTENVLFTGENATYFIVLSDTLIKAVVPLCASGYVNVFANNANATLSGFTFLSTQPRISGFTPLSGNVGTTVTISGTGFSSVPEENVVYFGAVRAAVTAASYSSINVIVPAGATYDPMTVTRPQSKLISYSSKPFVVTFPFADTAFTAASFGSRLKFSTAGINPFSFCRADFDGDGKTDIALVYGYPLNGHNTVSIYRNISTNGIINFAAPFNFVMNSSATGSMDVKTADMNGDGKLDLLSIDGDNLIGISLNSSTSGNISFDQAQDFVTGYSSGTDGTYPVNFAIADFDKDGKPDLIFANYGLANASKIGYMRNISVGNTMSFSPVTYILVDGVYGVYSCDLNNDNKTDVGVDINQTTSMNVASLRNMSTVSGTISFQSNGGAAAGFGATGGVCFGDLDMDGKADMVSVTHTSTFYTFRNLSNPGDFIVFDNPESVAANFGTETSAMADMNGDGKPDVLVTGDHVISLFKNISLPGNIVLSAKTDYITSYAGEIGAADLDGDGLPEIIVATPGDTSFSVFKNNARGSLNLCPSAASGSIISNIAGTSYQWQVSIDSGVIFNNINNGINYSGSATGTLQLNNIPSSFNGYLFHCIVDGNYSMSYRVKFTNNWTGTVNNLWNNPGNWSCNALPDANTDVIIPAGNVIVNVNATCGTLTIQPGATININTGVTFVITH
ncbi:MAG: FG-GAP-like repeat-containing protein [Ferruginibacter sp.]